MLLLSCLAPPPSLLPPISSPWLFLGALHLITIPSLHVVEFLLVLFCLHGSWWLSDDPLILPGLARLRFRSGGSCPQRIRCSAPRPNHQAPPAGLEPWRGCRLLYCGSRSFRVCGGLLVCPSQGSVGSTLVGLRPCRDWLELCTPCLALDY